MNKLRLREWLPVLMVGFILIICGYGWIANIVHLVKEPNSTGMFVVRVIGIFMAPLGAVMGYL